MQLSRDNLRPLIQSQKIEQLSVEKIFELFRHEEGLQKFVPDGICRTDPRDGAVIIYNSARAKRPHGYHRPDTGFGSEKSCPVCEGNTTGVLDVAELSEGVTFINKNLFPMLFPDTPSNRRHLPAQFYTNADPASSPAYGLHFLQWTSSLHSRDWHNMPLEDCRIVMRRLAALEEKLLLESTDLMPASRATNPGETRHAAGYVSIIKNCGPLVGGSMPHGHQQIAFSNVMPRRFLENQRFQKVYEEKVADFLLRKNPKELMVFDYGRVILLVPYFMRRPYASMLVLKDTSKQYLHQLDECEISEVTRGWCDAVRAMLTIMPEIGREPAYNIVTHNGPGAGLYFEFLPYTQETGGYEHLGLWICQNTPEKAAETLREAINS